MPDADEIVVTVVHPGEGEVSIVGTRSKSAY
jgi:hypothetical protein